MEDMDHDEYDKIISKILESIDGNIQIEVVINCLKTIVVKIFLSMESDDNFEFFMKCMQEEYWKNRKKNEIIN